MPLDEVPDAPRNVKLHADDTLDGSLERWGYTEPVLLDERTGRLVAGHGRKAMLQRARDGGAPVPDGVVVDAEGRWSVPVVRGWASTDDAEAEAYLVASNRLTEAGGWDPAGLYDLLDSLAAGPGLAGTGYAPGDLDDLLASLQEVVPADDRVGGAGDDMRESAQRYAGKGIRSLILDYGLADFDELVATLARLRRARGLETNADAVAVLIREAAASVA